MAKRNAPPKKAKSQHEKFVEAARELGADLSEEEFKMALGKIAPKHGAWLTPDDAIRAIVEAQGSGTPLFGFDGAYLRKEGIQPSLEDSWDYSARAYPPVSDPYAHAIAFIRERSSKGLRFELVFGKPATGH